MWHTKECIPKLSSWGNIILYVISQPLARGSWAPDRSESLDCSQIGAAQDSVSPRSPQGWIRSWLAPSRGWMTKFGWTPQSKDCEGFGRSSKVFSLLFSRRDRTLDTTFRTCRKLALLRRRNLGEWQFLSESDTPCRKRNIWLYLRTGPGRDLYSLKTSAFSTSQTQRTLMLWTWERARAEN